MRPQPKAKGNPYQRRLFVRRVLEEGWSVAAAAEAHWRSFLESLQARGLVVTEMVTSDDHAGLRAARRAVFPNVPWQRCQFHLQQNAQAYVPRAELRPALARELQGMFAAAARRTGRLGPGAQAPSVDWGRTGCLPHWDNPLPTAGNGLPDPSFSNSVA